MAKLLDKIKTFLYQNKILSNNDIDLSDDNVFNRNIKGIKQLSFESDLEQTGLVFTGGTKLIKQKELSVNFCVPGTTCDRCGKKISILSGNTICDECEEDFRKSDLRKHLFETDFEKKNKLDKIWFIKQLI